MTSSGTSVGRSGYSWTCRLSLTDGELAWADLFDHGLTSKTALVLVAWLSDEFGVDVPPRALWGDPYVAALAELVGRAGSRR
ncbi:acyl carrier protein [Streptomyces lasalocidi]